MANPSLGSALARQTRRPALALAVVPAAVAVQLGLAGGLEALVLVATLRPHWCPALVSAAVEVDGQALVAALWVVFRQVC